MSTATKDHGRTLRTWLSPSRATGTDTARGPGVARCLPVDRESSPESVRLQAAVVRALADHVERSARDEDLEALSQQLDEEQARLHGAPYRPS